ncbi:hypothetical protein CRP227_gp41 [Roseobacter phage CRP-227]|uniref:Tail fiber protein n=1 Tax=Roseobacter phage CRP-227 TaxID=3072847 RepID=A0AAX3ZX95_9CAUD|nr:hypothetical protein CRP227_gp41 [Roseobacter phage CRP-227]
MAIKVNGTTVIDDNRNLVNIASGAGSSTNYGAVGTYLIGYEDVGNVTENTTIAGSSLFPGGFRGISGDIAVDAGATGYFTRGGTTLSGTWRRMFRANTGGNDYKLGLHVRIS